LEIKSVLESPLSILEVVNKLRENPFSAINSLFLDSEFKNVFFSCYGNKLSISSNSADRIEFSIPKVREILNRSKIGVIKLSEIEDEELGFNLDITLVLKDVNNYCNNAK